MQRRHHLQYALVVNSCNMLNYYNISLKPLMTNRLIKVWLAKAYC